MREIDDKRYSVLSIDSINSSAVKSPQNFVNESEAFYNAQVLKAATTITLNKKYKFVLLCGPSASGKTTTAHKLKHRIIAQGRGATVLSMDDFFRGLDFYPKMENGTPDMESFQNINIELLNQCFDELMQNGKTKFPKFDFSTQKSVPNAKNVELNNGDVLIMEGIHALNPKVLEHIDRKHIYRMYVSVRSKFVDNDKTVLVPKDIRLMRRMVRDYKFRNYSPVQTLKYWHHVVASEKINIDTYRDDVEQKLDNTIEYEVCVWREILDSVLSDIHDEIKTFPEILKIYEALMHFNIIDHSHIPQNSLLREFIGNDM